MSIQCSHASEPQNHSQFDEEERKAHTLFAEPQDRCNEILQNQSMPSMIQLGRNETKKSKRPILNKIKQSSESISNKNCGRWSIDENKKYHWFLEQYHQHFTNKCLRRTDRIFKSMAFFIQTRVAEQCRSHHQKMEKKYKCFPQILMSLRQQNYNQNDSRLIFEDMKKKIQNLRLNDILASSSLQFLCAKSNSSQKQSDNISTDSHKTNNFKFQMTLTSIPFQFFLAVPDDNFKDEEEHSFDYLNNIFNDTHQRNIQKCSLF